MPTDTISTSDRTILDTIAKAALAAGQPTSSFLAKALGALAYVNAVNATNDKS